MSCTTCTVLSVATRRPPHTVAGSKLRICSFWLLLSCRGNVTSNLMMRLPFEPGCLLMGMPSPLRAAVTCNKCWQGQGHVTLLLQNKQVHQQYKLQSLRLHSYATKTTTHPAYRNTFCEPGCIICSFVLMFKLRLSSVTTEKSVPHRASARLRRLVKMRSSPSRLRCAAAGVTA